MSTVKLYLPYGTFGNANDRKRGWYSPYAEIILHWFIVGREEPLAPYESLILGYARLAPANRTTAERTVNEFFSESEFHQLRDYLRSRHNKDLRTAVLCAPVPSLHPDANTRTGMMRPFYPTSTNASLVFAAAQSTPGSDDESTEVLGDDSTDDGDIEITLPIASRPPDNCGFCRLSEESGYTLPFTVWGYYAVATRPERVDSVSVVAPAPPRPYSPPAPRPATAFRPGATGRSPR